jgi:hypothetical protein
MARLQVAVQGIRRRMAAIASLCVLGASSAHAEPLLGLNERPGPFVREAFALPYGEAVVVELGNALTADADPQCLLAKRLTPETLRAKGGELLVKWGTRTIDTVVSLVDANKYAEHLTASAGQDAAKELEQLRKHADVARYVAVERSLRLTTVVDFVVAQFDHYALLTRLRLRPISSTSSGNEKLIGANPTERLEQELDEIAANTSSGELMRFLDLQEKAADAMEAAIDKHKALLVGPGTYFGGVEADLAKLCITAHSR